MVILNLPREERYKLQNIILVGIIPGQREPSLTINSYIAPLISELKDAYRGWNIELKDSILKTTSIQKNTIEECEQNERREMCIKWP